MKRALILIAIAACSKKAPSTGSRELDAFEAAYGTFKGAYLGNSGLFVDRKLAVTPDKLATPGAVRAALGTPSVPSLVLFDIDDKPAPVAFAILRDLAKQKISVAMRDKQKGSRDGIGAMCTLEPRDKIELKDGEEETVQISIDVQRGRTWIGLSRVDEYMEIVDMAGDRDWEKLEVRLSEHKASAFFYDRNDLQIAVDPALSSADVLHAALIACKVGFVQITFIPRTELSARIPMPVPFDVSSMTTAKEVREKMRTIANTYDGIEVRLGSTKLCDYVRSMEVPPPPTDGWGDFHSKIAVLVQKSGRIRVLARPDTKNNEFDHDALEGLRAWLEPLRSDERFSDMTPIEVVAEEGVTAQPYVATLGAVCAAKYGHIRFSSMKELSIDPKISPHKGTGD